MPTFFTFGNQRLVCGEPNVYLQVNGSRNCSTILQRATKSMLVFPKQRTYYPVARFCPWQGRHYVIPLSQTPQRYNLICNSRKASHCLGIRGKQEWKEITSKFRGWLWRWLYGYRGMSKFELRTLNILNLYHVSYPSINLSKVSCCPVETCPSYNKTDELRLESVIGIMGQRLSPWCTREP